MWIEGVCKMLTKWQEMYLHVNPINHLVVGESALARNGLMYSGNILCLYTPYQELDGVARFGIITECNHFEDGYFCKTIDRDNLWLPSAERALVDTINFLEKNYIEGPLIESLQTYLSEHEDLSELYKVADFYNVPKESINYWINEALEETDMSMG